MFYSSLLAKEDDPRALLADVDYCAEEMLNGRRLLISKHGGVVRAFNRARIAYALPLSVMNLAQTFPGDYVVDGELVRESFVAFDILEGCGVNICSEAFVLRRKLLALISPFPLVAHACGETDKTSLFERVRAGCGAGVVFKRIDTHYDSGHDIYGVRFNNYRSGSLNLGDLSIEKCSVGACRDGKRRRPPTLWPSKNDLRDCQFSHRMTSAA